MTGPIASCFSRAVGARHNRFISDIFGRSRRAEDSTPCHHQGKSRANGRLQVGHLPAAFLTSLLSGHFPAKEVVSLLSLEYVNCPSEHDRC
jgi:hypothetical protein